MSIVAVLGNLVLLGMLTYEGVRAGLFAACCALVKNLLAFLFAVTLCEPGMRLLSTLFPEHHPAPQYYRAIAYALVFGIVMGLGRWLKISYAPAEVPANRWADRVGGGVLGLLNGTVLAGMLLILWSLMPFVKFLPGDFGRIRTEKLFPDTGLVMLKFYDHCTHIMGGGRTFLLESEFVKQDMDPIDGLPDVLRDLDGDGEPDGESFVDLNGNGQWDRGWLWRYRHHAEFRLEDLHRATGGPPVRQRAVQ